MMDTLGNIRILTDTDLRQGRERMVMVCDKDDNVIQIDKESSSKESKSLNIIITVVFGMMHE